MNFLKFALKVMFITVVLSSSFYAHDQLVEFINKGDLKRFKEAYEKTSLSQEKRAELLDKVNLIIHDDEVKLKRYSSILSSRYGKELRCAVKLGCGFAALFGIMSIVICATSLSSWIKKFRSFTIRLSRVQSGKINPRFGASAAQEAEFAQFCKRNWIYRNFLPKIFISAFSGLCGVIFGALAYEAKMNLPVYKRWKKLVKIKKLIEQW